MPVTGDKVTFYQGTQSQYEGIGSKDANGIYFISDSRAIYKGSTRYGSGDIDVATPDSAGVVKPSTDFDIAADGTLSLYQPMKIDSFTNNVGNLEKGATVDSVTLSWSVNKTPTSQELKKDSTSYSVAATDTSKVLAFTPALAANSTFSIKATDARGASDTKTTAIKFLNGIYYGIGTVTSADQCTSAFVQTLTKRLATSRVTSFTVTAAAGQYVYFACPASFGTPAFFVGGFEGGFNLLHTFSYTNVNNYSESYNVYKTTNVNLGTITVEVK